MVTALAVLLESGGGLSPPPLGSPGRWSSWLHEREPMTAAFALLRVGALGGGAYLVIVTALGVALRAIRAARLVAVADRFTVAPVRRLLAGTITAGLVGLGPVGAAVAQPAPSTTSTTAVTAVETDGGDDTVVLRRLPADTPVPPAASARPATPAERPTGTWTVQQGDCFWTIAEEIVEQAWGRTPTDAEIVPYWRVLIEANRQTLADKGNADLVFPGQVFDVPPAPPAPRAAGPDGLTLRPA